MGPEATARANALFGCVSEARLVLKVCALPRDSIVAEWTAERVNYKLCPPLWGVLDTHLGPLKWDLMASDGRERPSADGRGQCAAPLHTVANEGLLGGERLLPNLDRETRVVCQPRLRHDAAIPQPGARPESSGGVGCPWVGRFGPRGNMMAPLDGVRHGPGLVGNKRDSGSLCSANYGWRVGTGWAGPLGCLGRPLQLYMSYFPLTGG